MDKRIILCTALGFAIGVALFVGVNIPIDQTYNFGGNDILQGAFSPYLSGIS